jgi:hypothetical protein
MRILCLLNEGADPDARRWIEALPADHEIEIVDLAKKELSYVELVERIFAADRVISW